MSTRGSASLEQTDPYNILDGLLFQFTTTLPIEEHGVSYNQTMTLNVLTGDVLFHVPKHYRDGVNFYEMYSIENEDMVSTHNYSEQGASWTLLYRLWQLSEK